MGCRSLLRRLPMKYLLRNRKGQGTTEYIVILALVVIAVIAFWGRIKTVLDSKVTTVTSGIASAQ